jgi:hypothetical protein
MQQLLLDADLMIVARGAAEDGRRLFPCLLDDGAAYTEINDGRTRRFI